MMSTSPKSLYHLAVEDSQMYGFCSPTDSARLTHDSSTVSANMIPSSTSQYCEMTCTSWKSTNESSFGSVYSSSNFPTILHHSVHTSISWQTTPVGEESGPRRFSKGLSHARAPALAIVHPETPVLPPATLLHPRGAKILEKIFKKNLSIMHY